MQGSTELLAIEETGESLEVAVLDRLHRVLARLRVANVPFCILRNRDRIPGGLLSGSDVDLLLPAYVKADRVIELMADLRPVHVNVHRTTVEMYFPVGEILLHVDFLITDREWRGACYLKNEDILRDAREDDGLPVASPLHQAFCAWFSNLTRRCRFKPRYIRLIGDIAREHPDQLEALLYDAFGRRLSEELLELALHAKWQMCDSLAGRCRRAIWLRAVCRRPFATLAGAVHHYFSEARRYLRAPGISLALVGPDGAGKSAVCQVLADMSRAALPFRAIEVHHLYRRMLPMLSELRKGRLRRSPRSPATVHQPHGKRPHGIACSVLRLTYFAVDQWLSRLAFGLRRLAQNALLIHDRHLLEVTVDPIRFRYGGPRWFAQWALRLVPKPDMVILLDAPADVLHSRKREVPMAETVRQRDEYRAIVEGLPSGRIVDATQTVEQVVADVKAEIIRFLAARASRRASGGRKR